MEQNEKVVKELNKFLTGLNVAHDTFKTYEEKCNDKSLKNEFSKVTKDFESKKKVLQSYIDDLGGKSKDSPGMDAKLAEIFQKLKDVFMNNDKDILHHAMKNIERGIPASERVYLSLRKMTSDESILKYLNDMIDEYKHIYNNFEEIYNKM
ncbi:DUF2383 domain-containing protein [Terrisporobacter sp.]